MSGFASLKRLYLDYAGAVSLSREGCRVAGLPEMKEPSLELVSYRHELGVMDLGIEAELSGAGRVLTERELRNRHGNGELWSVPIQGKHAANSWPDLVLLSAEGPVAFELELAAKRSSRLVEIVEGYERSSVYHRVRFVLEQGAVAERISKIAQGWRPGGLVHGDPSAKCSIEPWTKSAEFERVRKAGEDLAACIAESTLPLVQGDPVQQARLILGGSK